MRATWTLACTLTLGLLSSTAALAVPVTYTFTGGTLDVTGTVGATPVFSASGIPLSGTHVTFDDAVPELVDLEFTGGDPTIIPISPAYGGFDGFTLDTFTVVDGAGFTNFSVTGGPTSFAFTVGPIDASGSATPYVGATAFPSIPFAETSPSLSGTIDLGTGTLTLSGITLLVIAGIPGEPVPLVVKGDIMFHGMVPEPGLALLLTVGIGFAAWRSRSRA